MKKRMVLFLFILSAINSFIVSQTFLDKFQGIPIIINNWNPQDNPYYDYSHADSIADGLIGMTSTNTDNVYYNQFVDGTRLKVIPYNGTLTKHNTIAKYSEGAYSYWDILSSRYSNGSLAITPNDTLITTVMDQQLNKSVLITRNFADTGRILSSGPGIMEKVGYDIEPPVPNTKEYTRTDSLKIILNTAYSGSVPPITTDSTVICIITTLYKSKNQGEITLGTQIVKVRDLAYDNWVPITSSYNFSAVPGSDLIIKESISLNGDPPKYVPQIDFRIEWKKVDYLNLLVNSITVWDDRGIAVLTSNDIRTEIKRIAVNGDSPTFPSGSSSNSFDSTIIAFHTVDEPECIDNFAVIKEIDKLLNNASGGKVRLFMSIANSWNGRLGNETIGEDPNWKVDEILARTDLVCPSLNAYMFNCPYTPEDNPTLDYKMLNISALINSLERFNSLNKPFFLGIQNGLWISPQNNYCRESPTNERFLYNINIGLLYGAKGFVPMNYFAREHDSITGFYDPDPINTHPYSSLYNLTRDTIKPRLSGLMGKTIKKLIPTAQYAGPNGINENYNVPPSPRYLAPINNEFTNCLDYIMPYNNTTPVNYYIDYGFFRDSTSESTRKYLMIINRYYSESIYHEVIRTPFCRHTEKQVY
ncbi:MAG: hypothetical protein P4L35_08645 [Ignavibacteriaceae bacterium]|nr:hypothetical protein [Ignavibacteriaceae bacterium]